MDATDIHKWYERHANPADKNVKYSKPMVDYDAQKKKMIHMYESV